MEVSTDSTIQTTNMYNYMNNKIPFNSSFFVISGVVLFFFIVLIFGLGSGSSTQNANISLDESTSQGISFMSVFFVGLVILVIFLSGIHYFYSSTAFASLKNIFSSTPVIDLKVDERHYLTDMSSNYLDELSKDLEEETKGKLPSAFNNKQVFNIPGNYFGYEDAKSICEAYGARLAKYEEVENAYNAGGEWCNYGWTDGQMALFPTQKSTFDTLQTIKGHEHDCGRPGVNGGYMANPKMKFGVNCYGVKPAITTEEKNLMDNTTPYPKTEKDILMEKKVKYWKKHLNELLVSPFNKNEWSRY